MDKKPSLRQQLRDNNKKFKDDMRANNEKFKQDIAAIKKPGKQNSKSEKKWYKRKIVWVTALIILIIALSSDNSTTKNNDQENKAKTGTPNTAPAKEVTLQNPAPPALPKPKIYKGTGDDVVDIQKPDDGPAILKFECPSCTSNTVVKTNGAESLLVNTIGAYLGSSLIDVSDGSNTTKVTVTAVGSWKLTISGLDKATEVSGKQSGTGDSVLHIADSTSEASITNSGDSNFVVNVYPENGGYADLAVNTIGSYKGTVPLEGPAYVQITSNGKWSVSVQ